MQIYGKGRAKKYCDGQEEEQAAIILHDDAEDSQVAKDRAANHSQRKEGASPGKSRREKQDGSD